MEIKRNITEVEIFKNAAFVNNLELLSEIEIEEKNIAIYQRDIYELRHEIEELINSDLQFKLSGTKEEIQIALAELDDNEHHFPLLSNDIRKLLDTFERVTITNSFRIALLTVNTNMCRRFHTDINDIRLLCTYSGPGTFWLPEEAADRRLHHQGGENEEIVINPELIQQAEEGDVLLLKGALYPNAQAVIHRSPSVEESGVKRLLLRIDTNEFANFI